MYILFSISVCLAAGLLVSRLSKIAGLPSVTAYLVAGILIGPYFLGRFGVEGLGFISAENVKQFDIISDVALGFIAFSIGNEFRLSQLKKIGGKATFIGIFQAVVATLFVDAALIGLHLVLGDKLPVSMALVLGSIAAATAPAATLMVVKQYKAKGKLTDLLLPIVAIDDAVGLMIFAVSFGIAKALENGEFNITGIIVEPILEIVLSLLLGSVVGFIFPHAEKMFSSNSKRLSLSLMFIFLSVALCQLKFSIGGVNLGFSPLLTCMMLGTMFCNLCDFSPEIMDKTDRWSQPLLLLFFVLSGAELELNVFKDPAVVGIGLAYIISR
ncbi:MAG: cation:proton antiporter, partial [Clostridia bacterium]|nr:cation:proton antiporter [Clostridia bacterium]